MPVIRDFTFNLQSTNTQFNVPVAAPATVSGDLMIGLGSADTGTQEYFGGDNITYVYGATAAPAYTDYSAAANNTTANDVNVMSATPALNAASYYGSANKFASVSFLMGTAGSGTWTITWEYYNGTAWVALPSVTDPTTNWTAAAALHRTVRWSYVPGDWATTTVNGTSAYWVRARVSAFTSSTTAPLATQVWLGNWQQLFATVNTSSHGVIYKIAGASEPSEYQIFYTVAETANGLIMSIRDFDNKLLFSTAVNGTSYSQTNVDSYVALNNTNTAVAQSFTAATGRLASCKFYLKKSGSPTGTARAILYAHSGTLGTSSVPTGVPLQVSDTFDVSTLTTSPQLIEFTFPWSYPLTATNLCIALEYTSGTVSNYVEVGYDASASSGTGNRSTYAGSWTATATEDLAHFVYHYVASTGTHSTTKSNMPTMTTSRDKTLLLYMATNSGVAVPSIIEGPVTFLVGKDGSAHSDCCSWSIQYTAGITANNVGLSNMTAAAGTTSVIGVNPPSSGTVVVPGYCVSDSSVYVSPFTGAAYGSDAVPVNTITTQMTGQQLNGTTLTNAVNTYTLADYGINTYHAMAKITGVSTSNTWAGWSCSIVARTNLASKNILFHISPQTPIAIQTTDSVALDNACGISIGLGTSANNFKFWHVHGSGTSFGAASYVPVVINTDNTTGVIQTTGSLDTASIARIALAVSAKVTAVTWLVQSVWALDTTVIAGGSSTEPLSIPGIESAASYGHERRSATIQGAGQLLVFQPLQFGDGGTNGIYLDLNATAIEFPTLYNKDAKKVNYCSVENFAGITYYAGASDTIKHRNSVVSSESKYKWGFHASSSGSATYDFNGLTVIGAGTITLHASVNLTGVTWSACDQITAAGNTLTDCIFTKGVGSGTQGAISITGASQSALQTALDKLVSCSFLDNTLPGGALKIIYTGAAQSIALNMSGLTFSGNTKDIYWDAPASSALTINNVDGSNPSTYTATNSNTVTFQTAVTVEVHCVNTSNNNLQNIRVAVYKKSDNSVVLAATNTNASGIASTTFNYVSDTLIYVRARSSAGGTRYFPVDTSGTITSTGYSVTITMQEDTIAA